MDVKFKRQQLSHIVRAVCIQHAGTGIEGYLCDDYAMDVTLAWGKDEIALDRALACFNRMKRDNLMSYPDLWEKLSP